MFRSCKRLLKSFHHAIKGLKYVFKSEQNFRIQIFVAVLVIVLAIYFPLKVWEVVLVILLVLLVLLMEILNTAIEKFNDLLKPRLHHYVRITKDIMAGGVLLVAVVSAVLGLVIFLPHFINLFK